MPKDKSEMDQFLGDIPVVDNKKEGDIFDVSLNGEAETTVEAEAQQEEGTLQPKNRADRRYRDRWQEERAASKQLTDRVRELEAEKFARATASSSNIDVDDALLRLYGNDENGRAAAKITQQLLDKTRAEAEAKALDIYRSERQKEVEQEQSFQQEMDNMVEEIEDEFNVDLTSDTPAARKANQGFLVMLQKLSPKNERGVVTSYADPLATWEMYQEQAKKSSTDTNRAKDLSSRSMVRSGGSVTDSKLQTQVAERFLKDAGII